MARLTVAQKGIDFGCGLCRRFQSPGVGGFDHPGLPGFHHAVCPNYGHIS